MPQTLPNIQHGVALVTGAGSGMGRAIALEFAAQGARVVVVDINGSSADETVQQIRDKGGNAVPCQVDLTRESETQKMVDRALSEYGRLDFAANVAGVSQAPLRLHRVTLDDYERDQAVNARGVFLSMKYEIAAMLKTGAGSIVNVTSGAGIGGFAYYSAYCAAKHAAVGLTRSAALEYAADGIRVNSVAPGAIATPMLLNSAPEVVDGLKRIIPAREFGTAENIAAATIWLCSNQSGYITGQVLPVDGAFSTSALSVVSAFPYEEPA